MTVQTELTYISGGKKTSLFAQEKGILSKPFPSVNFDYGNVRILEQYDFLTFPGRGRDREKCKEFMSWSCECGRHRKNRHKTCHRIVCPLCYQEGINRQAGLSTNKFMEIKKELKKKFKFLINLSHFSLNTMYEIKNEEEYKKRKRELLDIMIEQGMSGILIDHPWRKYRKVFTRRVLGLRKSWHWHIIAIGKMMENDVKDEQRNIISKGFGSKYGFNYSKIRNVGCDEREIFGLLRYLMSHTGKIPDKHVVTWFGNFANNKFKTSVFEDKEIPRCEKCGSFLYRVIDNPILVRGGFYDGFVLLYNSDYELDYQKIFTLKKKRKVLELQPGYRKKFFEYLTKPKPICK